MKHIKVFESFDETESICNKFGITNWTENSDGLIDVNGTVYFNGIGLKKLPLKFMTTPKQFSLHLNFP